MQIETSEIITILTIIVSIAVAWGKMMAHEEKMNRETERINKELSTMWEQLSKYRDWISSHEKDSNQVRLGFLEDISSVREAMALKDGKLDEILGRLQKIENKIDKLETK